MSDYLLGVIIVGLFGIGLDIRSLKRAVEDTKAELREECKRNRQEVGGKVGDGEQDV